VGALTQRRKKEEKKSDRKKLPKPHAKKVGGKKTTLTEEAGFISDRGGVGVLLNQRDLSLDEKVGGKDVNH